MPNHIRNRGPQRLSGLIVIILLTLGISLTGTVIPVAPNSEDLMGDWFGFNYEANAFCRISLSQTNGALCFSGPAGKAKLYKVPHWKIERKSILKFSAMPLVVGEEDLSIQGKTTSYRLELIVRGSEYGWEQNLVFYRENRLIEHIHDLQKSMSLRP